MQGAITHGTEIRSQIEPEIKSPERDNECLNLV